MPHIARSPHAASIAMFYSIDQLPDMDGELTGLLAQIPRGRVTTYGTLARALGDQVASRWVGHFLMHHDHRPSCACHRVVRADGSLGLYNSGEIDDKSRLLTAERVEIAAGRVDLARYDFDRFRSDRPLAALTKIQAELAERHSLQTRVKRPQLVAGVDVSYAGDWGIAAYALVETAGCRLVWSTTVKRAIAFPYITSYLAFRELPILLELLATVRHAGHPADVLLVDGSGILHQRHAGIATHLGVLADVPTLGVTKKLLCGSVDLDGLCCGASRPVVHDGLRIGAAIRPTETSKKPIFVSPGHLIGDAAATRLVTRLLSGRRLPEPIYWADRLSRREARSFGS